MIRSLIAFVLTVIAAAPAFAAEATTSPATVSTFKKIIDWILEAIVKYSFQALGGMVVLMAGWFVAKFAAEFVRKFLDKHKIDVTVAKFMVGTLKLVIMGFAVLIALGKFGIEIAPFIAGLSVIGFGTSFAL